MRLVGWVLTALFLLSMAYWALSLLLRLGAWIGLGATGLFRRCLATGLTLVVVGAFFLPMSFFLREELVTSVGADESSSTALVPVRSEAAERGIAYPGEGSPARTVLAQLDRSEKVLLMSVVELAAGVTLTLIGFVAALKLRRIGLFGDAMDIAGTTFKAALTALVIGFFVAFLTFAPAKVLPDAAFDVVFTVVVVASAVVFLFTTLVPGSVERSV